jgi:aldo/keto reductase family protein
MAYSPLGGPGADLLHDPTLQRIGAAHGCSAAAVALAWAIRSGNVIAIPESGSLAHVKENAVALSLTLTAEELQILDAAHPPSGRYDEGCYPSKRRKKTKRLDPNDNTRPRGKRVRRQRTKTALNGSDSLSAVNFRRAVHTPAQGWGEAPANKVPDHSRVGVS